MNRLLSLTLSLVAALLLVIILRIAIDFQDSRVDVQIEHQIKQLQFEELQNRVQMAILVNSLRSLQICADLAQLNGALDWWMLAHKK